jgi:hypothetical protein
MKRRFGKATIDINSSCTVSEIVFKRAHQAQHPPVSLQLAASNHMSRRRFGRSLENSSVLHLYVWEWIISLQFSAGHSIVLGDNAVSWEME